MEIRDTTREQDMFIRFKNGSTWQVIGSDNFNNLVGAGTVGMNFSEWALANPQAWSYFRPMLKQNRGWATFITTPRGRNHAHKMYESAKSKPGWLHERVTAEQSPVFSAADLAEERAEYIEAMGDDDGDLRWAASGVIACGAGLVPDLAARLRNLASSGSATTRKMALLCLAHAGDCDASFACRATAQVAQ
jgi:hypothetical protein